MRGRRPRYILLAAAILWMVPPPSLASENSLVEHVREAVARVRHDARPAAAGEPLSSTTLLPAFYERRQFQPAWTPSALDSLIDAVRGSALDGLGPDDYHLAALLDGRDAFAPETPDATRAAVDLIATDALIRLGYHARFGKVDQQRIFDNWNFTGPLTDTDPIALMDEAISGGKVAEAVQALFPRHPFYLALKAALARYGTIGVAGGWGTIASGPTIKPGAADARVPDVRRRLAIEDELPDGTADPSPILDATLAAAVARFQTRHGLVADGAIGAGTVRALNVPVSARIDQLRISLDRARSVMHDLPRRFVLVNVAGFTVYVVDGDWPIWESPVVVGKPFTETPIFRADMTHVVLNPTWTVPPGIMRNEIQPGLRRDPAYLAKKGLEWQDGQVVQPAGPKNALGRIKLMFPN
ncbi:MAG: murein L,D-transpeptidase, partial [Gemmatimonadales bacterium]